MPKIIWMFWLQGWDNATELSKRCLQSWEDLNPEWTVTKLSKENIGEYIDLDEITDEFYSKKPISCTVDIINLNLLKKYGGIWIDSTVMCLKPLDNWLEDCMASGIFTYKFDPLNPADKTSNKKRLLSTWFIAADKDNYIIDMWCKTYNKYWLGRSEPTYYFDFHFLFYDLYLDDAKFKRVFDKIPSKSAELAHYPSKYVSKHLKKELRERILHGEFAMTKFQNIYESKSYEGEEVVMRLLRNKHDNHLTQSTEIRGLIEMQALTRQLYQHNNIF
jgi:hypothetical protein